MGLAEVLTLLSEGGGRVEAKGYKSAREPRLTTFRTIQVGSGGHQYEAIVRNMSPRGALIEGLWNVPMGTALRLEFGPGVVLEAQARWSIGNRVGVQFSGAIEVETLIAPGAQARSPVARRRIDRAA